MDINQQIVPNSSFKTKIKQSLCFSCTSPSPPPNNNPRPIKSLSVENRSPSKVSWIWIRTKEHDFPEIIDMCANVFNWIGKHYHHHHYHHRRCASTDLRYDHQLNFQDNDNDYSLIDKEARLRRSYSSRLPASSVPVSISAFN